MSGSFGLLGPLAVWDDAGQPVSVPGRKPRAVLAMLLLAPNQAVTSARIIKELWGQQPPKTAAGSVQFFVHRLRDVLSPGGTQARFGMLTTQRSSYLLCVEPTDVDVGRFELLIQQATVAREHGDRPTAWARYGEALGLWRGEALADFPEAPFAAMARATLEQQRLRAHEARLEVGLELGWHAELVGELEGLVCEQPHQEGLQALLMRALYGSGRQAEALAAYQAAREVLVENYGMEPGAQLQELQRAILTHDPRLEVHPRKPPGLLAPAAGPHPQASRPRPSAATPANSPARPPADRPTPPPLSPSRVVEERKLVTALAVGVAQRLTAAGGASDDPEDVRAQTAAWQQAAGERISHYGGEVQSSAMGRLLAVFGAQRGRADDPERAVRAALEIVAAASPDGRLRAAVATDETVVSHNDVQLAGTSPTVLESAFILAMAVLDSTPDGTVLVADGTYGATRRVIGYRPSGDVAGTWQALGPAARTGVTVQEHPAPLVERDQELRLLRGLLDRCLSSRQPQLVTLVSAPGLGKTRLVGELARLADAAPELVTLRIWRCLPDRAASLSGLAAFINTHAGIADSDAPGLAADKLGQAVTHVIADPDEAAWVTSQLQFLLGPAVARDRAALADARGGWVRFVGAVAAARPMVMVVEDLHWADEVLQEFLADLINQVIPVPLLVVCTARTEWLDRTPGWGGGVGNAATISLSPLSHRGAAQLLDALLDQRQLPASVRQDVLAAAAGNPLYVEEYVRLVGDGKTLAAALARTGGQLPIPLSVKQLLAARIETLDPHDKRLLQDAAVIDHSGERGALTASLVAAVSGRGRDQVQQALGRLERQEFVRRLRDATMGGETEYVFRHPLISEVAYRQLLRAERATRHQRAAAWLQRPDADPDGEQTGRVAYHYRQALTLARAAGLPTGNLEEWTRQALRAAGQEAMLQGATNPDVAGHQQAFEPAPANDAEVTLVQRSVDPPDPATRQADQQSLGIVHATSQQDPHRSADLQTLPVRCRRVSSHCHQAAEPVDPIIHAGEMVWVPAEAELLASRPARLMHADQPVAATDGAAQVTAVTSTLLPDGRVAGVASSGALSPAHPGELTALHAQITPVHGDAEDGLPGTPWRTGVLDRCVAAVPIWLAAAAGPAQPACLAVVVTGRTNAVGPWTHVADLRRRAPAGNDPNDHLHPQALLLVHRMSLWRGEMDPVATSVDTTRSWPQQRMGEIAPSASGDGGQWQLATALPGRVVPTTGGCDLATGLTGGWLRLQPTPRCATPNLGWPRSLLPGCWHAAVSTPAAGELAAVTATFVAAGCAIDVAIQLERVQQLASAGPRRATEAADPAAVTCRATNAAARRGTAGHLAPAWCMWLPASAVTDVPERSPLWRRP